MEGIRCLLKWDAGISSTTDNSGQIILRALSEPHLSSSLHLLQETFSVLPLLKSPPFPRYYESTSSPSPTLLAKTANRHNRFYVASTPLPSSLLSQLDSPSPPPPLLSSCLKKHAKYLSDECFFSKHDARRIWCFDTVGGNCLVDCMKGGGYVNEWKQAVIGAFSWVTSEGVLCEERMRGVRYNIVDAIVYSDAIHRGNGPCIPAVRKVLYGTSLAGKPILQEPLYLVEICTPKSTEKIVLEILTKRKATIIGEKEPFSSLSSLPSLSSTLPPPTSSFPFSHSHKVSLRALLPVYSSLNLTTEINSVTNHTITTTTITNKTNTNINYMFYGWKEVEGDPLDPSSLAGGAVAGVRRWKGLGEEIPPLERFIDKL